MRFLIRRRTRTAFPAPVREHHCELRLAPADDGPQRRRALRIAVRPAATVRTYTDAFGNLVHYFDVRAPHEAVETTLEAEVETDGAFGLDVTGVAPSRERAWIAEALRAHPALWDFVLHRSVHTPEPARFAHGHGLPACAGRRSLLEEVWSAIAWVRARLAYAPAADGDEPLAAALERRAGGARDFAHALVTVVRSWGVPARFVAGYLDPGSEEGDAARAVHAWVEVLLPELGWRGFDPVHQRMAGESYVRVAVGRDDRDVLARRSAFSGLHGATAPRASLALVRQHQQ